MAEQQNNIAKKQRGAGASAPFHCITPVQMRYTDFDMHGHVNNSVYLNFFDIAKIDYFEKVRSENLDWENVNLVIASMHIDFLSQTTYIDNVAVQTQTLRLGNKSLTLLHELFNTDTREVKCSCTTVLVYLDTKTHAPAPIPQAWRDALTAYEGYDMSK